MVRTVWAIIGQPIRVIAPSMVIPLPVEDIQNVPGDARERAAARLTREQVNRGFDLEKGPLLRACLIKLSPEEHIFIVTMHHLICDGWSMGIFARELRQCYEASCKGASPQLPDLPIQYADYAVWRRTQARECFEELVAYWKKRLENLPPLLPLPTDGERSTAVSLPSASLYCTFSADLTERLKAASQREGVTLFLMLLAIFQLLLNRLSGLADIGVAMTVAERANPELQELIGFFVGLIVVRTDFSGDPAFTEVLQRVRNTTLEAFDHQDSSAIAEALMREIGVQEYARLRGSSFKAFFTWINVPEVQFNLPNLDTQPFSLPEESTEIGPDIVIQGSESGGSIKFRLIYKAPLFSSLRMRRFSEQFQWLAAQISENPTLRIKEYSLETSTSGREGIREFLRQAQAANQA